MNTDLRLVFENSGDIYNVFLIDAGIVWFGNIGFIWKHIERYGFWLTEETGWINYNFPHFILVILQQKVG